MLKQYEGHITSAWTKQNPLLIFLRPLSLGYRFISSIRRVWYKLFASKPLPVPVVVIGNITVGGSGKTPVVISLAKALAHCGFKPGIISRGYKGSLNQSPTLVSPQHKPEQVGDEPLLMHYKANAPVVIGRNRLKAAQYLLECHPEVNVILSDDGMQHYRLPRDVEIAMVEPKAWGNRKCLPEGPLREPLSRLKKVNYLLSSDKHIAGYNVRFEQDKAVHIKTGQIDEGLESFRGRTVHAVAGIANPNRFFDMLRAKGIHVIEHAFNDHHAFRLEDLAFNTAYPILMTEKDAIKCQHFNYLPIWVVSLSAKLDPTFLQKLIKDISHG